MRVSHLLLFAICVISLSAAEKFSTKDHIKGRGVNFSLSIPDGMRRYADLETDSTIAAWYAKTGHSSTLITLQMYKHNMHSEEDKFAQLDKDLVPPHGKAMGTRKTKVGHEPAVISECRSLHTSQATGLPSQQHEVRLWIHPGDTTICLLFVILRPDHDERAMNESVDAIRPLLEAMLKSVALE